METPLAIEFLITADGSATARFGPAGETMHSQDGAFSETRHVYQPAVTWALAEGAGPHFLSVGLGLGYNEIILASLAGEALWSCESYEARTDLRDAFLIWVRGGRSPWNAVYDTIAARVAGDARENLRRADAEGRWRLRGALGDSSQPRPATAILYDAFSRVASPRLWESDFLDALLARAARPTCVFATYASTGTLKRVLARHRFVVEDRAGFARKRECTFAIRKANL